MLARNLLVAGCVAVASCVCGNSDPKRVDASDLDPNRGSVHTRADMFEALKQRGLTIEPQGLYVQPFFPEEAQAFALEGDLLYTWEFADGGAAVEAGSSISTDGHDISSIHVDWMKPPQFYLSGRLLALYLGDSERISWHLENVLGPSFAGSPVEKD